MASLTPLPQSIHHSTTRLTHREAHTLLSTFLQTADTNPAYRPDSTLSPHGVVSSSTSASQNLTLNHLGRILKGIAGERVGGTGDFDNFFGYRDPRKRRRQDEGENEGKGGGGGGGKKQHVELDEQEEVVVEVDGGAALKVAREDVDPDEWVDKEDYEHAQVEGTRELLLGDEDPTRVEGYGDNEVEPGDLDVEVEVDGEEQDERRRTGVVESSSRGKGQKLSALDKESRKRAKKEKRKEEQGAKNKMKD